MLVPITLWNCDVRRVLQRNQEYPENGYGRRGGLRRFYLDGGKFPIGTLTCNNRVLFWNWRIPIRVELNFICVGISIVTINKISCGTHDWPTNTESWTGREMRIRHSSGASVCLQPEGNLKLLRPLSQALRRQCTRYNQPSHA